MRNAPRLHQRRTPTLEGHNIPRWRSLVYLDIPLTGQKWLNEAWVGRLKNLALFDRVEDDLLWDIGANISPKYIGDNMVLLLDLTEDKAKRMIDEEREGGASLFHSLEKWNLRICTGYRLTWVHCWGIPLVAWDTNHIQKIVATIGDLVDVDGDVEEIQKLDRA